MSTIADIQAELDRQGQSKRSPRRTILVLIISLALFASTGVIQATWASVAMLVAVLFIHEAGHWIGMQLFGYRDIQMFFIPFFGAAVSGKDSGVGAARKAVVSLLGPVPGIILGAIAYYLFLTQRDILYFQFCKLALLLNFINLLPFYPLDGGRFFDVVIFSRHPTTAVIFKVLAALVLGAVALALGSIAIGIVAALALRTAFDTYYQNKLLRHLKDSLHGQLPPPPSDLIPPQYLEVILPDLNKDIGGKTIPPRAQAIRAQNVWKRLTQPAPTLGATIILLAVYAAVFVVGLLASSFAAGRAIHEDAPQQIVRRTDEDDKTVLVETRTFGKRIISERQINAEGFYDGPAASWTTRGVKEQEGTFSNGFSDGRWKFYGPDGTLAQEAVFDHGKLTQLTYIIKGELVELPPDKWPFYLKYLTQQKPTRTRGVMPKP